MMKIIHTKKLWWGSEKTDHKDCLALYDDRWNDYGYHTTFFLGFYDVNGKYFDIGSAKIYYYDYDKNRSDSYSDFVCDIIPDDITQLNDKFCSLGQSLSYYQNLKKYCPDDYLDILHRLNDIAVDDELKKKFIREHGVQTSLRRDLSAEKALNEAKILLNTDRLVDKDVSFTYSCRVPYASSRSQLHFDFKKNKELPYRINVLIGKNGVGKTQILSNLADVLSGISGTFLEKEECFNGKRPPIDKVISISYSAFDEFRERASKENDYKGASYAYCGIKSGKGTLSVDELKENFNNALKIIRQKDRLDSWKLIMQELFEKENVDLIEKTLSGDVDHIHFSSGQYILLCTMTEVISTIEKESLLLFDEPELHLHPNAVANTLRMFCRLLEEFDSYAIFATHSPLIVQEIPSRYIQILSRIDDVLAVRKPMLECFGENVTNITNDIFDVNASESNYKSILKQLSMKLSFDEVLNLFEGKLSLNAMIYLKGCYGNHESVE